MFKDLNENFLKVNQILPYKEDENYIYIFSKNSRW